MGLRSHCSSHTITNKLSRQKTQKLFSDLSKRLNAAVVQVCSSPWTLSAPSSHSSVSTAKPGNTFHLGHSVATLVGNRVFTGASPPTIPPFLGILLNFSVTPASVPPVAFSASPQRSNVTRQPATHQFRDHKAETEKLNSTMAEKHNQKPS